MLKFERNFIKDPIYLVDRRFQSKIFKKNDIPVDESEPNQIVLIRGGRKRLIAKWALKVQSGKNIRIYPSSLNDGSAWFKISWTNFKCRSSLAALHALVQRSLTAEDYSQKGEETPSKPKGPKNLSKKINQESEWVSESKNQFIISQIKVVLKVCWKSQSKISLKEHSRQIIQTNQSKISVKMSD